MAETLRNKRVDTTGRPIGVREDRSGIDGIVVAELGDFKDGRGQFVPESLQAIVRLAAEKPNGFRMRWTHPSLSADGLGKYLSRAVNFRIDDSRVRADAVWMDTARKTGPDGGDLSYADYLMDLAAEDDEGYGVSLALREVERRQRTDENGDEINDEPPIWIPLSIMAVDFVDTGAATNSLLSADQLNLPDAVVRQAAALIDRQFPDLGRDEIKDKLAGFVDRYLLHRFPTQKEESSMSTDTTKLEAIVAQLAETQQKLAEQNNAAIGTLTESVTRLDKSLSEVIESQAESQRLDNRNKQIRERCKLIGCEDLAEELIRDRDLSLDDATMKIFAKMAQQRPGDGGGDDKTGQKKDPALLAAEEWEKNRDVLEKQGTTKEEYVRRRTATYENVELSDDGSECTVKLVPDKPLSMSDYLAKAAS